MVVWICAVTCVRPEELAFKWSDLKAKSKQLWIVRAVNCGKFHTPKYHRGNRPIQLTDADVERLLALKRLRKAGDGDWMFPNSRNTAPIRNEDVLGRKIQPIADKLGLPHITWHLLRHLGRDAHARAESPTQGCARTVGALTAGSDLAALRTPAAGIGRGRGLDPELDGERQISRAGRSDAVPAARSWQPNGGHRIRLCSASC